MARLRIRMELNRGRAGVPLLELARVVDEAQKFFGMLGDDVHIDSAGEWVASDFDNEFLNFTAEFTGVVEPHRIEQFRAAFDGVTRLRRATIAQFARIASALGEDETIAFGLFRNDEDVEPDEWRSLSKREAMRIESEIRELLAQTGESGADSAGPAVLDTPAVTNLFGGPDEQGGLAGRVARLESEIARQAEALEKIRATTAHTDQGLQRLVVAVDAFCERATRHLEQLPPAAPEKSHKLGWRVSAIVAVIFLVGWWLFRGSTEHRPADSQVRAAEPARITPPPATLPTPLPVPPRASRRIDLRAIEPDWVTVYVDGKEVSSKLMKALDSTSIEQAGTIRIRFGNAGGVEILMDGNSIGPIGRRGAVATIEFTGASFRILPNEKIPAR